MSSSSKHRAFYCSKSKTIHGGTPVQIIMYINYYKGFVYFNYTYKLLFITLFDYFNLIISIFHCLCPSFYLYLSSSGTSQLGMFDIQATTKSKYYDHIVLLYLESRRCRYRSIIFACFYLYIFHCLCPSFYLYLSNR
jgi:hypothetical protein